MKTHIRFYHFLFVVTLLVLFLPLLPIPSSMAQQKNDTPLSPQAEYDEFVYLPVIFKNFWRGYFDDFSDPNSGWITGDTAYAAYGYLGGEYQIYLKQTNSGLSISPGIDADAQALVLPADYLVEVDARKVSAGTSSYGLRFGVHYTLDSYETYQVIVYPTTGEFFMNKRTLDGTWSVIQNWTYSSAINQNGGTNHIAVERIGTTINLYVNGSQIANIIDDSFVDSGRDAGLVVYSYDDAPDDVRFDNFSASQP